MVAPPVVLALPVKLVIVNVSLLAPLLMTLDARLRFMVLIVTPPFAVAPPIFKCTPNSPDK